MSTSIRNILLTTRNTRTLLLKWIVALLAPLIVFTFVWQGYVTINKVLLGFVSPTTALVSFSQLVQASVFIILFYAAVITLAGYLVATDSGHQNTIELWIDIVVFTILPLVLVSTTNNLIIGIAISALVWAIYFPIRRLVKARILGPTALSTFERVPVIDSEQRTALMGHAITGSFWLASALALVWLAADLIYYLSGQLPSDFLISTAVRTLILPCAGYLLGLLGGRIALRRVLSANKSEKEKLKVLSTTRVKEEADDLIPNDLPWRSSGAKRFYLLLVVAFVLCYPALDPFLFGYGTAGRLAGYGDAGYYVILALGLNIVVGFAGLLDLGYVAFFAIGAYTWGMVGSTQLSLLTGISINPQLLSWLFWPMLLVTALFAAFWGIVLGAPTLRLRGDYLAIVTLGFGEIVPVVFLNLDKFTNGTNGLVGVRSPAFFGIEWSTFTPLPYYYLILALIALTIFANIRLRDSRLGRAWVAIREDEIAAASSGVNLVNTKLFAFAAGAFFSGIAGAYSAAKLGGVSPDTFGFGDSVIYLAMVVIGGIGSIPGVIVGALTVYAINLFILAQLDTQASDPNNFLYGFNQFIVHYIPGFTFGNIRNLIFGLVLVVVMIFRPEGLIPNARRRRELHHHTNEESSVEITSLDVPPGAPDFEAEVHVE